MFMFLQILGMMGQAFVAVFGWFLQLDSVIHFGGTLKNMILVIIGVRLILFPLLHMSGHSITVDYEREQRHNNALAHYVHSYELAKEKFSDMEIS